jgi:hypothetical protein
MNLGWVVQGDSPGSKDTCFLSCLLCDVVFNCRSDSVDFEKQGPVFRGPMDGSFCAVCLSKLDSATERDRDSVLTQLKTFKERELQFALAHRDPEAPSASEFFFGETTHGVDHQILVSKFHCDTPDNP